MLVKIVLTEVWEFANETVSKKQKDKMMRVIGLILGLDKIAFLITKLDSGIN
jgi:hypothetical protein